MNGLSLMCRRYFKRGVLIIIGAGVISISGCNASGNQNWEDGTTPTHSGSFTDSPVIQLTASPSGGEPIVKVTETINSTPVFVPTINVNPPLIPSPIGSPTVQLPSGERLFLFGHIGDKSSYGFVVLDSSRLILPARPEDPNPSILLSDHPNSSVELIFSIFRDEVAYLTINEDGLSEIRLSDLDITNPSRIWVDTDNWLLGPYQYDEVRMTWGPLENSIILTRGKQTVIVSITERQAYFVTIGCNWIGHSPVNNGLSIWCKTESDSGDESYLVVEADGSISSQNQVGETLFGVQDWQYSLTGENVVFVDDQLVVNLLNKNLEIKPLPAKVPSGFQSSQMRYLKWAGENRTILVYGEDTALDDCPDPEQSQIKFCWMMIDIESAEIIWRPPDFVQAFGDADISSDLRWVAFFFNPRRLPQGWLLSLETSEYFRFFDEFYEQIKWEDGVP